ncbi:tyrosine-type recombinase/integrase [Edaphobacter modestus]|uniref:Site-specific recombinase XerD n=1 Tax=Edaphobacter modestus TaxID=388466 RepID=A0A4V2G4Y1_9BACT|nr:tyrosine-type recombinase/integrase [Edaphobacter modestus]RZU42706.1 site-specific recombinase XerD [Edaphobacter modestus]
MEPRFEQFLRERQYLHNVSSATIQWYRESLCLLPCESPSQEQLIETVIKMRERGRKATGCNVAIRAINSYMHWNSGTKRKCGSGCEHPRIQELKEPQEVLPTFSEAQIKRLVAAKPKGKYQRRTHLLALFLLDTGARISEALGVRVRDIDFDNLLVTLDGKGRKQRVVPFSFELRRALFLYCKESNHSPDHPLFASRMHTPLGRRDMLRDIKIHCERQGVIPPVRTLHAFRHTFAVNYLRRGGSVFHLQKSSVTAASI